MEGPSELGNKCGRFNRALKEQGATDRDAFLLTVEFLWMLLRPDHPRTVSGESITVRNDDPDDDDLPF